MFIFLFIPRIHLQYYFCSLLFLPFLFSLLPPSLSLKQKRENLKPIIFPSALHHTITRDASLTISDRGPPLFACKPLVTPSFACTSVQHSLLIISVREPQSLFSLVYGWLNSRNLTSFSRYVTVNNNS